MQTKITDNLFLDLQFIIFFHYIKDGDSTLFLTGLDKPVFVSADDAIALRNVLDENYSDEMNSRYQFLIKDEVKKANETLASDGMIC